MSSVANLAAFDNLPGLEMVDARYIGLPVFLTHMDVLTEEKKSLHIAAEYALRLVSTGVSRASDIAALLGLSVQLVDISLADLLRMGAIQSDGDVISITRWGHQLLTECGDTVCTESVWYVPFDGLLKRPHAWPRHQLLTGRQLRDKGHQWELAPFGERPKLSDVSVASVTQTIADLRSGVVAERLIAIRGIRKVTLQFVPAIALGYQGRTGPHVAFVIDGRLSESHGESFIANNGLRRPTFSRLAKRPTDQIQERATLKRRLTRGLVLQTVERLSGERKQLTLPGRHNDTDGEITIPKIYQLAGSFERALNEANKRLIVTSRTLSQTLLRGTLELLRKRLESSLEVHLGLSARLIEDIGRKTATGELILELMRLEDEFTGFNVSVLPETSHCHLIKDSRHLSVGDYDWLTHEGNSERELRYRWVLESTVSEIVDREAARVLSMLQRAKRAGAEAR